MSYNFGQLRRNQISSYLTPLTYTLTTVIEPSPLSEEVKFKERVIQLDGNSQLQELDETGTKKRNYYLRLKFYKQSTQQVITIQLYRSAIGEDFHERSQTLKTITIKPGDTSEYEIHDIIIPPNSIYDQVKLILNRGYIDYMGRQPDGQGVYGRVVKVEVLLFSEIDNVIDKINSAIDNKGRLIQIGVQSFPGLQMCIDGEEIRVGRSGIYEINNGVSVKFLGFIVEEADNKYFILDYQY